MTWICGVDGSPAGWVVVAKEVETSRISWSSAVSLNDIRLEGAAPEVIAIDIPIGLTEEGPRQCDLEARQTSRQTARFQCFSCSHPTGTESCRLSRCLPNPLCR